MSKHQPYQQLWRQWTTQRRLGAAAALSLSVSLLCLPWAITKGRSLDKLLVICVGLVSTEAARRSAFGYFDHRDSDADLVFAEKRELIQQHIQVLRDDELVQPELSPANDESNEDEMITNVVDYWKQQEKHLLVIGGTNSGKTTFVKNFSKRLSGFQTKVYDCDATVDDWGWADVVYHEFEDISQHMTDDLALIPEIRKQRYKDGKSWQAEPTLMIADEFPALVAELAVAKKWLSTHAKQTRKHKRMIAILSQNDTVANLGLKGDISVRDTCFTLVYLGKKAEERAKALDRDDWINVLKQEPYKYAIVDDKLAWRP